MKQTILLLSMSLGLLLAGCGSDDVTVPDVPQLQPSGVQLSESQTRCVPSVNSFSSRMFRHLSASGKSMVVSPISAAFTLGMVNEGAEGATGAEILAALGLTGQDRQAVNDLFARFIDGAPGAGTDVSLCYANMVAVNSSTGSVVSDGYISTLKEYYDAPVLTSDFSDPAALKAVNGWCSEHTGGQIPAMMAELNPTAVMYLLNAVSFKAAWADPFDKGESRGETFRNGSDTQTIMMMHKQATVGYCEQDGYKAIRLAYGNGAYNITFVLPDTEGMPTAPDVLPHAFTAQEVKMALPVFTTEAETDLRAVLTAMGVRTMFTPEADLRRMTGGKPLLYVSDMRQKARLGIDEEGARAAAVTEAELSFTSAGPGGSGIKTFYANRPFAYYISESTTGAVLFIGQFCGD
jgi:serpin B